MEEIKKTRNVIIVDEETGTEEYYPRCGGGRDCRKDPQGVQAGTAGLTAAEMNEEGFVRKLAALFPQSPDVKVGPGDDCAVLDTGMPDLLLAAVDQVITDVHYCKGCPPAAIAGKLLRRNVSDIASMGGIPTHALLSLAVNP